MSKFLDLTGLTQLVNKLNALFDKKVDKVTGKGLSTNDYTTAEKEKLAGIAEGANKYTHPNSGVTAGTYRSVTVNKQGHVTAGTNPATLEGYGITEVEADKITGTINIANLPQGALERCVVVADDDARFALTSGNVQTGDTVKVTSTGAMYFVKDDTKLSNEEGYEIYTAGSATSAAYDSKGQNIASTYVKGISLMNMSAQISSGNEITGAGYEFLTVTKGDNSTSDIKFNTFTREKNGLVPAPLISTSTKFLRDDGEWVVPNFLSLDGGTINDGGYIYFGAEHDTIIRSGYIKSYNIAVAVIDSADSNSIEVSADISMGGDIYTDGHNIDLENSITDTKGNIEGAGTIEADTIIATTFEGSLTGNAASASSVPWSGVTGVEYATEEDILALFD